LPAAQAAGDGFAVVIMDLTIPGGMGGREAVQKLLVRDPSAKVIAASGYANDPVLANHRKFGFRGVLRKPFDKADLAWVLRVVL